MFPTSLEHPYAPRGRRRGRNDPNSRDYICPCGKSYLSYPALFTHIKIKHNGRAPGQIIKPKSQNVSKRGRPRQKEVYDSESDTNDIAANCIDRLCDFVTDFDKPDENLARKIKQLYMKNPFYNVYVNFNPQQQEPHYNERQDLYQEYCDNVFCQLIAQVNKRLNEPFHIDLIIVVFMFMAHFINQSSSGHNLQNQRIQADYAYGQYAANQLQNAEHQEEYDQEQEPIDNQEQEIVEEEFQDDDQYKTQKIKQDPQIRPRNSQPSEQSGELQQGLQGGDSDKYKDQIKEREQCKNQEEEVIIEKDDPFFKLKQEPIRNIVNFINGFIISYPLKYQEEFNLKQFQFFAQPNIKQFIELLFNWLTMKKYVGYKVQVNKSYN